MDEGHGRRQGLGDRLARPLDLAEAVAPRIRKLIRRMIEIGKTWVEAALWSSRIEPVALGRRKAFPLRQPARLIVGKLRSKGKTTGFAPFDHGATLFNR